MNSHKHIPAAIFIVASIAWFGSPSRAEDYAIVDTGQERTYDNQREIEYPKAGQKFFGQDAHYSGHQPSYRDNRDGTITDQVTGLMWVQDPGPKKTYVQAVAGASTCRVGKHADWRLPSIKELYSLIQFRGEDVDPRSTATSNLRPFIDTKYFKFSYGDASKGERIIDSQFATSTKYVSTTMRGDETVFGVNFADGRIKSYPTGTGQRRSGSAKGYYVFYVRGNAKYGKNDFHDNRDGTITDRATGLTWAKVDSGHLEAGEKKDGKLNWEQALAWVEKLEHAGHSDWRLPSAKELQSIVDYTRSPDTTRSAAISPQFEVTPIRDGQGQVNYPNYWTGTTHKRAGGGDTAVYVAFGRSQGWMQDRAGEYELLDVHGAGSQRSDPKSGDPSKYPRGRGPQGDVIGIDNFVRPVRGGVAVTREHGPALESPGQNREGGNAPKPRAAGGRRSGFVDRLDRDGDGKVSREEFRGPSRAFDRNDRDGDGFLSEDEAPQRRRSGNRDGSKERANKTTAIAAVGIEEAQAIADNTSARATAARNKLPPSFVFILIDDMGWTGLSTVMDDRLPESKSDYYETPQIASLAAAGMRFSHAYAPAPMCTPSRASLLTGKSPAQLHMTTPGPAGRSTTSQKMIAPRHITALPTSETTIAELLKKHGYATAHFGKWHLSGGGPGQHGFDRHDGETGNGGPGAFEDPDPKDIFGVTGRAMTFMQDQVAARKPFYVQLSHYAVHSPNQALSRTKTRLADVPTGTRHTDLEYAAMTNDVDTSVGMLLKKIDALGIADSTYIVFMSDNGAGSRRGSGENLPLAGGKATLREGGIRVPLIARGPGVAAGSFNRDNIVGCDLFPTFCELAGVRAPMPEGIEGTSIVPLLRGNAGALQREREELVFHFPHYGRGPKQQPQSAILVGNLKLIRSYETGAEQLFDLAHDVGERTDLASKMPAKRKELSARLDAYLSSVHAQLPTVNPDYDPTKESGSQRRGRSSNRK